MPWWAAGLPGKAKDEHKGQPGLPGKHMAEPHTASLQPVPASGRRMVHSRSMVPLQSLGPTWREASEIALLLQEGGVEVDNQHHSLMPQQSSSRSATPRARSTFLTLQERIQTAAVLDIAAGQLDWSKLVMVVPSEALSQDSVFEEDHQTMTVNSGGKVFFCLLSLPPGYVPTNHSMAQDIHGHAVSSASHTSNALAMDGRQQGLPAPSTSHGNTVSKPELHSSASEPSVIQMSASSECAPGDTDDHLPTVPAVANPFANPFSNPFANPFSHPLAHMHAASSSSAHKDSKPPPAHKDSKASGMAAVPAANTAREGVVVLKFCGSRLLAQAEQLAGELARHCGVCAPDSRVLHQVGSTASEWDALELAAGRLALGQAQSKGTLHRSQHADAGSGAASPTSCSSSTSGGLELQEELRRVPAALLMAYIPGSKLASAPQQGMSDSECLGLIEALGRLFVLDMVLGNADRLPCTDLGWRGNTGNLLLGAAGTRYAHKVVAIDACVQRRPPASKLDREDDAVDRLAQLVLSNPGGQVAGPLLQHQLLAPGPTWLQTLVANTARNGKAAGAFQRGMRWSLRRVVDLKGLFEMVHAHITEWVAEFLEDIKHAAPDLRLPSPVRGGLYPGSASKGMSPSPDSHVGVRHTLSTGWRLTREDKTGNEFATPVPRRRLTTDGVAHSAPGPGLIYEQTNSRAAACGPAQGTAYIGSGGGAEGDRASAAGGQGSPSCQRSQRSQSVAGSDNSHSHVSDPSPPLSDSNAAEVQAMAMEHTMNHRNGLSPPEHVGVDGHGIQVRVGKGTRRSESLPEPSHTPPPNPTSPFTPPPSTHTPPSSSTTPSAARGSLDTAANAASPVRHNNMSTSRHCQSPQVPTSSPRTSVSGTGSPSHHTPNPSLRKLKVQSGASGERSMSLTRALKVMGQEERSNSELSDRINEWRHTFRAHAEALRTAADEWQARRGFDQVLTMGFLSGAQPIVDLYELKVRLDHMLRRMKVLEEGQSATAPARILDDLPLYLGNAVAADSHHVLRHLGITHILNATEEVAPPPPAAGFTVLRLAMRDVDEEDIASLFDTAADFIDAALGCPPPPADQPPAAAVEQLAKLAIHSAGTSAPLPATAAAAAAGVSMDASATAPPAGGVLVHCNEGRSRSVALVAAYLVTRRRMRLAQAMTLIRLRRPQAAPNPGFAAALIALERHVWGDSSVEKATSVAAKAAQEVLAAKKGKPEGAICPICGVVVGISSASLHIHMRSKHAGVQLNADIADE